MANPYPDQDCERCKFFDGYEIEDSEFPADGYCRRRSPRKDRQWPRARGDDWCGEFEINRNLSSTTSAEGAKGE